MRTGWQNINIFKKYALQRFEYWDKNEKSMIASYIKSNIKIMIQKNIVKWMDIMEQNAEVKF